METTAAGFTTGTPWLPVPESAKRRNVELESQNPNSVLSFYKQVLHLRRTEPGLMAGEYVPLNESDANMLSYLRKSKDGTILVVVNISGKPQSARFDLSRHGLAGAKVTALAQNAVSVQDGVLSEVKLEPYGVYIGRVSK